RVPVDRVQRPPGVLDGGTRIRIPTTKGYRRMRVAVAGSSGLIGGALVSRLRSEGHEVRRLVRRSPRTPEEIAWSPATDHLPVAQLRGVDAVVNLCGVGIGDRRWTGARKQLIRDSRVDPTEVIARAVAEASIPVLVNASAVGYYGDTGD